MANLTVTNLDERIVQALQQRAARHGCSIEAEHRAILKAALAPAHRRSLAEILAAMPDVGRQEDFERHRDGENTRHVFD